MSRKSVTSVQPERTPSLVEVFESAGDRMRRLWAENSGDWAFRVLTALQGLRSREISVEELPGLKIYQRSTPREKAALRYVAEQSEILRPLSEDDRIKLAERDEYLNQFADGVLLGHRDIVREIQDIPAVVARAHAGDRALFPHSQFEQVVIFKWLWGAR